MFGVLGLAARHTVQVRFHGLVRGWSSLTTAPRHSRVSPSNGKKKLLENRASHLRHRRHHHHHQPQQQHQGFLVPFVCAETVLGFSNSVLAIRGLACIREA